MNTIGNFTLGKKIGEGAYGRAYQAIDNERNKTVCVKIFKSNDQDTEKTWINESTPGFESFEH
jgi:serine/threonine protein kinase